MLPKAKFVVCSIIGLALSFWMKHLVIGQLQKPAKFYAFHWSPSRSQAFIGQPLGTSRVVSRNGLIHHIGCLITLVSAILADLIAESDKAVRAVHSCKSWFNNSISDPGIPRMECNMVDY